MTNNFAEKLKKDNLIMNINTDENKFNDRIINGVYRALILILSR